MSQIFTTPAAESVAKAWLHDVTLAAGIRTTNQRTGYYSSLNFPQWFVDAAIKVCDELINRDFNDVDSSIRELAGVKFNSCLDTDKGSSKSYNEEGVAKSIVYLAELLSLYWDDTVRTTYELDEFKKTLLGQAVFKYGRVISAVGATKSAGSTRAASSRAPGQPPKNNFKQSGPQSGNARDLRDVNGGPGQPGVKVDPANADVYGIAGTSTTSKNVARVFVKPLAPSGAAGKTNKVCIGSGKGFGDCVCWFEDPNDAQDFLDQILASGKCPANVTGLQVVAKKKESNGYFLVGTELGICAISAKALNEAMCKDSEATQEGFAWDKVMENLDSDEMYELTKAARK
jgi:hypothetical protein